MESSIETVHAKVIIKANTFFTYGENVELGIQMAKEAIELYIAELKERGEEIPDDKETLEYSISMQTT